MANRCEKSSDLCTNDTCGNNGKCVAFDSTRFVCECPLGFTGDRCETNIGKLVSN